MPALDQFCTVPSPSAWSLASDWSRHITWPEYWPLIGCVRRHYVTCVPGGRGTVPCLISPGSPRIITAPWPLRGWGAIQEANSGLTRHCWKQQILADIKLCIKTDNISQHRVILQAEGPDNNIALIFLLMLLNVYELVIWLDLTWFGTCCCWTIDSGWLHLYPCWLRQRHLAEPLLRLRAVPHHPRHWEAAQTREVSRHRPHSRHHLLTGIFILDSSL